MIKSHLSALASNLPSPLQVQQIVYHFMCSGIYEPEQEGEATSGTANEFEIGMDAVGRILKRLIVAKLGYLVGYLKCTSRKHKQTNVKHPSMKNVS